MADRYSYLPLTGVFIVLVWGAAEVLARTRFQSLALGAALICLGSLSFAAHWRVGYWHDSVRLYEQAFSLDPDDYAVNLSLGGALLDQGRPKAGVRHLQRALQLMPEDSTCLWNLGHACSRQNKWAEAIDWYRKAVVAKPDFAAAYCDLGLTAGMAGRYDEASEAFLAALRLQPDYTDAHLYFGNMLTLVGKVQEAIPHYEAVLAFEPRSAEGHYFLGMSLAKQNNPAVAVREFRTSLALRPDYIAAANDLAWILATSREPALRNVPEAIRLAEKTCEQSRRTQASFLDTLSVAYAAAGHFAEAIKSAEDARAIAASAKQPAVVEEMQKRLTLYRQGRAYEPPGL
jgi:tetratricopeptide (TPR) repeat protein